MKTSSRLLYLSIFAIFGPQSVHCEDGTRSTSGPPDACAIEPHAIVSDSCASFSTIENLNNDLRPSVRDVTQNTDFFSYYRLNLYNKVCPFWSDSNGMCGNRACAVETLDDEEDIPEIWRTEELSKLRGPKAHHPSRKEQKERLRPLQGNLSEEVSESCVVEYDDDCDDRDYCVADDEGEAARGDYVSLVDNPEKYTGYAGEGAHMVWDAIYRENCFPKMPSASSTPAPGESLVQPSNAAANDLRHVLQSNSDDSELMEEDVCLEKRVFYRVISGMHASISTHLCYDYLDRKTEQWGPNLTCYQDRIGNHPDRISNLYFNYGLMMRAMAKLEKYLASYTFCTGDPIQDRDTKRKVMAISRRAAAEPTLFDESIMFQDPTSAIDLKEDFRNRFRNVSRLMDCVGCDKCRLWGKLQTSGYGTALKVLFEFGEDEDFTLQRTELVALVNTLDRIGASIAAVSHFRQMEGAKSLSATPSRSTRSSAHSVPPAYESRAESDFDDDEFDAAYQEDEEPSFMDQFYEETDLVFKVARHVLREWVKLPQKVLNIVLVEIGIVWSKWLGLQQDERSYEWAKLPPKNEL